MAEHSAVNRRVVGSSPTWGALKPDRMIRLFCVPQVYFIIPPVFSAVDGLCLFAAFSDIILYFLLIQEFPDDIDMNATADMHKRLVVDDFLPPVDHPLLLFHVKAQMKMVCQRLHAIDNAVFRKQRSAALPAQSGGTHFDADDVTAAVADMAGNHSLNGELGCGLMAFLCPDNVIVPGIIGEIGKLGERIPQTAEHFAGLDPGGIIQKYSMLRPDGRITVKPDQCKIILFRHDNMETLQTTHAGKRNPELRQAVRTQLMPLFSVFLFRTEFSVLFDSGQFFFKFRIVPVDRFRMDDFPGDMTAGQGITVFVDKKQGGCSGNNDAVRIAAGNKTDRSCK